MQTFGRVLAVLGLAALAGASMAAEPPDPALKGLAGCAGVAEAAARAACYDDAYAALSRAVSAGEIMIVQRQEAQAAQRSAFGLNLPALTIFDRGAQAPLESVTGEVKRAYRDELGKWVVVLADGAVWRQIDSEVIAPPPRAGSRVEIRKAAFGSYFMRVDGQRGVRAKRSE